MILLALPGSWPSVFSLVCLKIKYSSFTSSTKIRASSANQLTKNFLADSEAERRHAIWKKKKKKEKKKREKKEEAAAKNCLYFLAYFLWLTK